MRSTERLAYLDLEFYVISFASSGKKLTNITRGEEFSDHVFGALGHPPIDSVGALCSIAKIDFLRHGTILFLGVRLKLVLEMTFWQSFLTTLGPKLRVFTG